MARETPVPRYYGSEIEYGFSVRDGSGYTPQLQMPPKAIHIGQFLENGSRLYPDVGLIEYATGECETLEELVTHELAGEQLTWDAYGEGRSPIKSLHKRALTPTTHQGTGAHENYTTTINVWDKEKKTKTTHINGVATHFATRTVYIGAGKPTYSGYALGQKMYDISEFTGSSPTYSKALVNTRHESHSGGSPLERLHVVCGDANISPWAIRMKYGTTSLVLRLLEHNVDINDLSLARPLSSAHEVARDINNINAPLLLHSGKTATALDIQEMLATRAAMLNLRIDLPKQEQEILPDWIAIIDALRRYSQTNEDQPEMNQLDWYVKHKRLNRLQEQRKGKNKTLDEEHAINLAYDLNYDQIPNGLGVKLRQSSDWFAPHTPSQSQIDEAKTTPPKGGRAQLRGALIKHIYKQGFKSVNRYHMNWGSFYFDKHSQETTLAPIDVHYTDKEIRERVLFLSSVPDL